MMYRAILTYAAVLLTALVLAATSGCEQPSAPGNLKPLEEPAASEQKGSGTSQDDQDTDGSGTQSDENGSGTR